MSNWILKFQNGCSKVVTELHLVKFWSQIILVTSNQTRASHSFWNHAHHFRPNCTPLSSITFINQTILISFAGILFLFFSNCIVFKLEKRVPVVFIPEFCTTAWARGLLDWGRVQLEVGCYTWKCQVSQVFTYYFLFLQHFCYLSSYELLELTRLFHFDLR